MGKIVRLFGNDDAHYNQVKQVKYDTMDAKAFRTDIIRPCLQVTGLWTNEAETLLLGTALAESNLMYVKQFQGGPALSFYQIEPATYIDTIRYLNLRQRQIKDRILACCYLEDFPPSEALIWHLKLATLITRMIYYMEPTPIPSEIHAMGEYYVKYFHRGKIATVEKFIAAWEAQ